MEEVYITQCVVWRCRVGEVYITHCVTEDYSMCINGGNREGETQLIGRRLHFSM